MATQRFTLTKLAGAAGTAAAELLCGWASLPEISNRQLEAFTALLHGHGSDPSITYFCEWFDHWSMGDVLDKWLPVSENSGAFAVRVGPFEIRCYALPDGGVLAALLTGDPDWSEEEHWFVARLREAVEAWDKLAPQATLIVIREVLGGSTLDGEVKAALARPPEWLTDLR
jgi:hypothetical protein